MPAPVSVPVLTDGVITLRPWAPEDAGLLLEASEDPAIQRYSMSRSQPFTAVEAQEQLRGGNAYQLTADVHDKPSGSLIITDAATGLALGQCGIDGWSPGDVAQIGYWLVPRARGRGIATRAVMRLTTWLFALGARRVFLTVVDDNHASVAVAQRAGFHSEGPTGEQSIWSGHRHEVLSFAVAADDWERPGRR